MAVQYDANGNPYDLNAPNGGMPVRSLMGPTAPTAPTALSSQTSLQFQPRPVPPIGANGNTGVMGPTPTGTPQPARGGTVDPSQWQSLVQAAQSGLAPTRDSLAQIVQKLNAQGVPAAIATHAGGTQASGDKIVMPDGTVVDVISNEGGPGAGWSYQPGRAGEFGTLNNIVGPDGKLMSYADFAKQNGFTARVGSNADYYTNTGQPTTGEIGAAGAPQTYVGQQTPMNTSVYGQPQPISALMGQPNGLFAPPTPVNPYAPQTGQTGVMR